MSFYKRAVTIGARLFPISSFLKWGLNISPMYRRSTARITYISKDLMKIRIRLPISYKNKNYVGSIFGGSMFAAVDPIPMTQLIQLLGSNYVVWDKSAEIKFKRPARKDLYAIFSFTPNQISSIRNKVAEKNEIEFPYTTQLTDKEEETIYCTVHKTIYIANKTFYKTKMENLKNAKKTVTSN